MRSPTREGTTTPRSDRCGKRWGPLPAARGFYPGMVPNSTGVIHIPNPPLQSITFVQYWDFQGNLDTVDSSLYNTSLGTPARIQPAYSKVWPIARPTIDAVQITFVCGYGTAPSSVPANVIAVILMLVNHWYNHRDVVSTSEYLPIPETIDALLDSSDHGGLG